MRSTIATATVLVFTVLSPTLTYAAPMGDMPNYHHPVASGGGVGNGAGTSFLEGRSLAGLGYSETLSRREHGGSSPYSTSGWTMNPKKFWKKATDYDSGIVKRLDDGRTLGGNAHSGSSGDVSGGSVNNPDTTNNQNMPVLMNMSSNNGGTGGHSKAGCAAAGKSGNQGTGGNASSGDSGRAQGGSVNGPPSGMVNMNSNNAGAAGQSETGCAYGGNEVDHQ